MSLGYWKYTGPNPFNPLRKMRNAAGVYSQGAILTDPRLHAWREALEAAHKKWAAKLTQTELEAFGPEGATFGRFLEMMPGQTRSVIGPETKLMSEITAKAQRYFVRNPNTWGKMFGHVTENALYDAAFGIYDTAMETSRTAREFGAKYKEPAAVYVGADLGFARGWHHNLGSLIGGTIGTVAGTAFGGHPIIGNLVGAAVGGKIGEIWDPGLNAQAGFELQVLRSAAAVRRVNFGGDFEDTQQAYTMRQQAVQEMSGSLMNARQYLGNEAAFFHGI